MSVTVADCLKLPSLKEAKVVAGSNGLDRIVGTVSVLEYVDFWILSHDFFIGKELVISALVSIKDDVEAQCKTVKRLCEAGKVGLIVYYVEIFVPKLDPRLLKTAEELNFPVIMMPTGRIDFRYSDVISEVMEAIFVDKRKNTYFVNSLLEQIAQLNEFQRTIGTVMRLLSDRLHCTLMLADQSFKSIGFATWPMANWLNEEIITDLFIDQEYSSEVSFTELIGNTEATVYRVPVPEENIKQLSLIAVDETDSFVQEQLDQAVEIIQLFASIWKYNLDYAQPDAIIPAVLNDNPNVMNHIAKSFNIDVSCINTMLIARIDQPVLSNIERHTINEKLALKSRLILKNHGKSIIADIYEGHLVALLEFSKNYISDKDFLDFFYEELRTVVKPISLVMCTNLATTKDVRKIYLMYKEYFETTQLIYPRRHIFTTFELQFAAECRSVILSGEKEIEQYLSPLTPLHGLDDSEDLINTLTVYILDAEHNTKLTGEFLYLHRNTVQYRMKKVKQKLDYDITKMPEAYTIYRAAALQRLITHMSKNEIL